MEEKTFLHLLKQTSEIDVKTFKVFRSMRKINK